jgi:flagellin
LNDGISIVQTAEGAIAAAQEMVQRILTLATQGSNGTMGTSERTALKSEMTQLLTAIDAIGNRTKFSGIGLLNTDARATATTKFSLQASHQTNDVVALASNAFTNIGGFSSAVASTNIASFDLNQGGATTNSGVTINLAAVTNIVVGMSVSGAGVPADSRVVSIVGSAITISKALTGTTTAGTAYSFAGSKTSTSADTATLTLTTGSNAPQSIVDTKVYQVSSDGSTYREIATVKSVSGDTVTLMRTSSEIAWAIGDAIVFSGQLTQKHSTTTGDVSLSQSVRSTTNDTANFQMVQRAADSYLTALTTQRSLLGAYQGQIEYTVSNVTELSSNLSAARSNVVDTDYASETAALTKGQILQQAATAMLAQANQMPNVILSLLK